MADLWSTQTIESYAWYLNSKHTALGEINSTRVCAFTLKHTEHFISKNPPENRQVAAPKGTTLVWLCGRWPRLVGGLWRGVNYTVNQLMHSKCGRMCRGAVGEGGLIRGGLLYITLNSSTGWILRYNSIRTYPLYLFKIINFEKRSKNPSHYNLQSNGPVKNVYKNCPTRTPS